MLQLIKHGTARRRQRCLEGKFMAGERVRHDKAVRVQKHPRKAAMGKRLAHGIRTILFVTDNRIALRGQMDADLMRAPAAKFRAPQAVGPRSEEHTSELQ